MVLKDGGKFGPVSSSSSPPSHFWLDVSVRNGENLSAKEVIESSEFDEILAPLVQDIDRLSEDLGDSTANDSRPQNQGLVGLSLNKKKRWLLPELLKEQILEESQEENTDSPTVTLIERGLLDRGLQIGKKADCRAVYTTGSRSGKCEKYAKRRYAHLLDLRKGSDLDDEVAEICFEVGHAFQNRTKPHRLKYDKRGSTEGKTKRKINLPKRGASKRHIIAEEMGFLDDMCEDFEADEYNDFVTERLVKTPTDLSLDCFLHTNKCIRANNTKNADVGVKPKKYGKGEAIVIPEPKDFAGKKEMVKAQSMPELANSAPNVDETPQVPTLGTTYKPIPESVMYFDVVPDSISTGQLLTEFEGSIEFSHTLPEKCMINLLPHMKFPRIDDYDLMALMMFELPQESIEDTAPVEIMTTVELRTESAPLVAVTKSLYYYLKQVCNTPISIRDIVGHIASFLSKNLSFTELRRPEKVQNVTLPLSVVHQCCGVEAEAVDFQEAVQELADKGCTIDCKHCTTQPVVEEGTGECGICFTEGANVRFTGLRECGHWFCDSCWKQHVDTQMGQMQINITCPAFNCTSNVNDTFVFSIAPHAYPRYKLLKNQALVMKSKEHHFCPGKDCGRVAVVRETGVNHMSAVPFACPCTKVWCTDCQEIAHWPVACNVASEFRAKLDKFGINLHGKYHLSANRIESVQVKKCPNCKYPIEKYRGCPHMHCGLCKFDFCWECLNAMYSSDHTREKCEKMRQKEDNIRLTIFHGSKLMEQHADTVFTYHTKWAKKSAMNKPYRKLNCLKKLTSTQYVKFPKAKHFIANAHNHQAIKTFEETLAKGLNFKYQAYFVLENMAVILSMFPKKQRKHTKHLFDTLEFTVQVVEQILKKNKQLKDPQVLEHLKRMVAGGQKVFGKLKVNKVQ